MNQQLIICNNKFLKNISQNSSCQAQYIKDYFEIELLYLHKLKLYSYYTPITSSPILGTHSPNQLSQLINYYSSITLQDSLFADATRCYSMSNRMFVSENNIYLLTNLHNNIFEYIGMLYNFF